MAAASGVAVGFSAAQRFYLPGVVAGGYRDQPPSVWLNRVLVSARRVKVPPTIGWERIMIGVKNRAPPRRSGQESISLCRRQLHPFAVGRRENDDPLPPTMIGISALRPWYGDGPSVVWYRAEYRSRPSSVEPRGEFGDSGHSGAVQVSHGAWSVNDYERTSRAMASAASLSLSSAASSPSWAASRTQCLR